jgi:selenocysteine lyase/cysteine desulfurase
VLGVIEYFEQLGRTCDGDQELGLQDLAVSERRLNLVKAMRAIRAYEYELSRALLDELQKVPGLRIYGMSDVRQLEDRVPTFAFRLEGFHPRGTADWLGENGINVWDGNYYAQAVTERLGLEESGGMVRIGAVHYNTLDEIVQFGKKITEILEK